MGLAIGGVLMNEKNLSHRGEKQPYAILCLKTEQVGDISEAGRKAETIEVSLW